MSTPGPRVIVVLVPPDTNGAGVELQVDPARANVLAALATVSPNVFAQVVDRMRVWGLRVGTNDAADRITLQALTAAVQEFFES